MKNDTQHNSRGKTFKQLNKTYIILKQYTISGTFGTENCLFYSYNSAKKFKNILKQHDFESYPGAENSLYYTFTQFEGENM